MAQELELPGGLRTTNNVPADAWYGPYADLATARAAVPTNMRQYRTVGILTVDGVIEYVWKNGSGDSDLVIKSTAVDLATEADYGTTSYGTQAEVEDAADNPTLGSIPANLTAHLRGLRWFINRIFATGRAIGGVWTAPTAAFGTNTTQVANTAFVNLQIDEAVVDRGTVSSGTLVIDCAHKNHKVILTGTVSFDYTNLVEGREFSVWVERTTNTTINFTASKWMAPLAIKPQFSDPTANGSSPAKAIDIMTFKARAAGERPTVVVTPDAQNI